MPLELYKVPYTVYLANNAEEALEMARKKWTETAVAPADQLCPLIMQDVVKMGKIVYSEYGFITLDEFKRVFKEPTYLGTLDSNGYNGYTLYFDKDLREIVKATGIFENPVIYKAFIASEDHEKGGINVEVRYMKALNLYRTTWMIVQHMDLGYTEVANQEFYDHRDEAIEQALTVLDAWKTLIPK